MTIVLSAIASLIFFLASINLGASMNLGSTLETIIKRQAMAWEMGDVSSIVRDFAPDAIFIAGGNTFRGVEAIKKAAEDYFREFSDTKVIIKRMIIDDRQGAVEWNWRDRNQQTNRQSQAEDAIVFEVGADGKIIYWREYIEKKNKT